MVTICVPSVCLCECPEFMTRQTTQRYDRIKRKCLCVFILCVYHAVYRMTVDKSDTYEWCIANIGRIEKKRRRKTKIKCHMKALLFWSSHPLALKLSLLFSYLALGLLSSPRVLLIYALFIFTSLDTATIIWATTSHSKDICSFATHDKVSICKPYTNSPEKYTISSISQKREKSENITFTP